MLVPSDHQAIVDELSRLAAAFGELVTPLSEAQLNWQPDADRAGLGAKAWSVGQCVEHLARANRTYLPALVTAAARGRSAGRARRDALRPNGLGRWFIREMEPPPRHRLKAPSPALVPASACPKEPTWQAFLEIQQGVVELVRATSDLDLTGIRFRNPLAKNLPLFNLATGFLVIAAHERRHLAQAQNVRARADFPIS